MWILRNQIIKMIQKNTNVFYQWHRDDERVTLKTVFLWYFFDDFASIGFPTALFHFLNFSNIFNDPNTFPMLRIIIDSFEITLKLKVKRKNLENLDIHKWQHWHLAVATANNELFPFQCICVFGFGAYFFRSHIDGFGYCIYILSTGCWLCRIVSWLEIKRNSVSLQFLFLFNLKSTKQTSEVILSSLDSENQSNM